LTGAEAQPILGGIVFSNSRDRPAMPTTPITPITPRERLLARRDEILDNLAAIEDQLDDTPDPDWADRVTERQGDEVLQALGRSDQAELRRIDAALARVEEGSYGTCARCGEEIAPARLNALPDTPFCANCAG